MAAQLLINQAGITAGTVNKARSDGLHSGLVTLSSVGSGLSHNFELLWAPEDDSSAASTFQKINSTTATFSPDPSSVGGSYRIKLTVVQETGVETVTRIFAILTSQGLRIPALNERASDNATLATGPSLAAESEFNENSTAPFTLGDYSGWYKSMADLYRYVDTISGGGPSGSGKPGLTTLYYIDGSTLPDIGPSPDVVDCTTLGLSCFANKNVISLIAPNLAGDGACYALDVTNVGNSTVTFVANDPSAIYVPFGLVGVSTLALAPGDTYKAIYNTDGAYSVGNNAPDGIARWWIFPTNTSGGGGGTGDVVGPASAVTDRIATYNGVTGKLIKDSGSTIAQVLAGAASAAAAGDVTTLAAAKTYTDAAVAPISCSYAIRGTAPMTLSCSALGGWSDYSSLGYSNLSLATITSHAKLVKGAGNSSVFTVTDAGTYFVSGWLSIAGSGNLFAMGVRVGGTVVLSSLSWAGSASSGDFNARVSGVVTVTAGATLSVDWILESSTGSFGLNSGVAAFNQAWMGGLSIYKI